VPVCKQLRIYGRVQGVGFRYWFADRARELKLTGWVRNVFDRSVEAVVLGPPEAVEKMIECAKTGPDDARVERIEIHDVQGSFPTFEIRSTR
jgi:acylphosphatase